jgi:hypothetical protein
MWQWLSILIPEFLGDFRQADSTFTFCLSAAVYGEFDYINIGIKS